MNGPEKRKKIKLMKQKLTDIFFGPRECKKGCNANLDETAKALLWRKCGKGCCWFFIILK